MVTTPYFQPSFELNHLGKKLANLSTDTLVFGLIGAGTLAARATSENYEFVSDLLANNGSALTETNGTGYARQNATSVTYTKSGLLVTLGSASPSWGVSTFTAEYAWLHDETASAGTDATRPLIAIWDLGGTFSPAGVSFTLVVPSTGLAQWAAAQ
jgi:hypothetical protein